MQNNEEGHSRTERQGEAGATALHRRHIEMQPNQGGIFEPTPTLLERAAVIT
jgi:hypothetical protein